MHFNMLYNCIGHCRGGVYQSRRRCWRRRCWWLWICSFCHKLVVSGIILRKFYTVLFTRHAIRSKLLIRLIFCVSKRSGQLHVGKPTKSIEWDNVNWSHVPWIRLYLLCIFSLFTSLISILIFGWRWNEWMWLIKNFPWRKIEFWWSLIHIFLMIAAGLVSFIGLANLSGTILEDEVIATGVFCFLGEFFK